MIMILCNCTIVFSDIEPKLLMKTSQLTSVGLPGNMKSLFCPRIIPRVKVNMNLNISLMLKLGNFCINGRKWTNRKESKESQNYNHGC